MAAAIGFIGGIGLFFVWWSCWDTPARARRTRRDGRIAALLRRAGIDRVTPVGFVASAIGLGAFVALGLFVATSAWPVAVCFGLFASWLPVALVRWQARRRAALLREHWPDAVDHLRSAIRAGLPLPEALIQLGDKGPVPLRLVFLEFAADYRAGGRFGAALDNLKERLADPVADRIVEALRLTREVGGSDLGRLLGTLAEFLRESARTRSELEARQSWTVNGARLAVAAPWAVLLLLATRPEAMVAYSTPLGMAVLGGGLAVSVVCYRLMLRIGALPQEQRVLG
ncbi:type II secretion system F family protein [Sinomonas sp. ASV322]|uniref:type II secretion system F family protein n=1 Tax=Sinomonas sp. ASV322 TaxID=3041920 RepID=UPI0027DDB30D|nr:type II secretion system F family protein [Sinomonas sp. ASV322]MDQ4503232.1 type II secretion system F family protein [Sinomonas sp. ASV322]